MLESTVEDHLVDSCKAIGVEVRKVKWLGRRHAPDRLLFILGGIWVELKRPDEEPRPGQKREHKRMRAAGMWVEVIDTKAGVDQLIRKIKRCLNSPQENTKN